MGATDPTSRMVELLGRLRREMNGAVADSMRVRGRSYGLNYGVSLPTIRAIARSCPPDHAFARYLFLQDVRELRLAALTLAEPRRVVAAEFDAWGAGIVNSEVAEEAAFALLSRTECVRELYAAWMAATDPLLRYAALLSAARSRSVPVQEALAPLPALAADLSLRMGTAARSRTSPKGRLLTVRRLLLPSISPSRRSPTRKIYAVKGG